MQLSKRLFVSVSIFVAVALALLISVCFTAPDGVAEAGICDLLTPEIVKFYEEEISKEAVLSNKSAQSVKAVAARFGIDESKAKCAILLYDLSKRTGGGVDFPEIAKMSDFKMIAFAKNRGEIFAQTLPQEEKEQLKRHASELIGIRL